MRIPFFDARRLHDPLREELHRALDAVLETGAIVRGPACEAFEEALAAHVGTRHAVALGSGHDALELVLRAMELGPEDEVIVPAMTFAATAHAVRLAGARLALCDVGPDGLLDPKDLEERLGERTRAVIVVHLHGQCAEMGALEDLLGPRGIPIVEDAAQALGATWRGRRAGSFGTAAAFSFYPTKPLGALGDGGAVCTDEASLARRTRLLGNYGSSVRGAHEILGRNSRLDTLQAAFLLVKMRDVEEDRRRRARHAARYCRNLEAIGDRLPIAHDERVHAHHIFALRCRDREERDALADHLAGRGIGALSHYPRAIHEQPVFEGAGLGRFPGAERFAATTLSLPLHAALEEAEVDEVAEAVLGFYTGRGEI